jgi:DNA helicase-2/ATP-dependent DNA helicase PcrA
LWDEHSPKLLEIITYVKAHKLFHLTDNFEKLLIEINQADFSEEQISEDSILSAWFKSLQSDYSQVVAYDLYISDEATYGTHQGVKGLEFPRVMVILDDDDAAGGFMFSYEKLFGAKALTATDQKNIAEGKDSSIDRTRRLFYVTCSRAEKSLAVVAYTNVPERVKDQVIANNWFERDEAFLWNNFDSFVCFHESL